MRCEHELTCIYTQITSEPELVGEIGISRNMCTPGEHFEEWKIGDWSHRDEVTSVRNKNINPVPKDDPTTALGIHAFAESRSRYMYMSYPLPGVSSCLLAGFHFLNLVQTSNHVAGSFDNSNASEI